MFNAAATAAAAVTDDMTAVQISIPRERVEQLRQLAQRMGSSLFVTALAAFKLLLRRYSKRNDLVVGTPSSGRNRPELQGGLVGCFVNLIMLRTNMAGKGSDLQPYTLKTIFGHCRAAVSTISCCASVWQACRCQDCNNLLQSVEVTIPAAECWGLGELLVQSHCAVHHDVI